MMAPVVVALQRQLQSAGAAAAETPREAAFQVGTQKLPYSCGRFCLNGRCWTGPAT